MNEYKRALVLGYLANSHQRSVVYDNRYLSPTIQAAAGTGGNQQPFTVVIK